MRRQVIETIPLQYKRIAEIDFHVNRQAYENFGMQAIKDAGHSALLHLVSDQLSLITAGAHLRRVRLRPDRTKHVDSWRWILSVEVRPLTVKHEPVDWVSFDHKLDEEL